MGKNCCSATTEDSSLLRDINNYESDNEIADLSKTGIKQVCVWNEVDGFHVTDNWAFDIMHDLLEGVCRYDLSHILYYMVHVKGLSWDTLNSRIQGV
jgi:hypothetical protein